MWVGFTQSGEGLTNKKTEVPPGTSGDIQLQTAFGLKLQQQLFPGSPASLLACPKH